MNWTCSDARRHLAEYHDGELAIDQQVVMENHLGRCPACASEARGLRTVAAALRVAAASRTQGIDVRRMEGVAAGVVSRMKAEREESLGRTVQRMFEDFHLVWAALGATAATFACLAITVGIFYFGSSERAGSLAAIIDGLSNVGSNAYPVKMDANILVPRQELNRVVAMPDVLTDEVWAVNATITREGRVADLQLLMGEEVDGKPGQQQPNWNTVGQMLDSAALVRFEPARSGGSPVAVTDMVWLLTRLTVRPKAPGALRLAVPSKSPSASV